MKKPYYMLAESTGTFWKDVSVDPDRHVWTSSGGESSSDRLHDQGEIDEGKLVEIRDVFAALPNEKGCAWSPGPDGFSYELSYVTATGTTYWEVCFESREPTGPYAAAVKAMVALVPPGAW